MSGNDFPNLNMSIGEYYKLLMEGKRPMRHRNPPKSELQPSKSTPTSSSLPKLKKLEKLQALEAKSSGEKGGDK